MIKLTIMGKPHPKERPRFARMGGFVKTYTPQKTLDAEKAIAEQFKKEYPEHEPLECALKITIIAYMPIAKSTPKKKTELMVNNEIKMISKPDCDNLSKTVKDALNGIAYKDDSQIVEEHVYKFYSLEPKTEIVIEEV